MDVDPVLNLLPAWIRITILATFLFVKGILFSVDALSTLRKHRRKSMSPVAHRCRRELQFNRHMRQRSKYSSK